MTINNRFCILIGMVFIFLSLSSASAQTLVAGKIYNSDYSETVAEASIAVTCSTNSLNTNSLNDGTYAIRFNVGLCNEGESVKVTATKDNLAGEGNGVISVCDENQNCDDGLVSIVNLNLKELQPPNPASSGGGGGSYYLCGNGKCDSGENERTCPKDCKITQIAQTNTGTNDIAGTGDAEETIQYVEGAGETIKQPGNSTFFSGITGAVVGGLSSAGTSVLIIFLIVLIGSLITVRIIRKRKNYENF